MRVTTKQTQFINKAIVDQKAINTEHYFLSFQELTILENLLKKALKSNKTLKLTLNALKINIQISEFPRYDYFKKRKVLNSQSVIFKEGEIIK